MSDFGFRLSEQEQMVQQMVRQWCEKTLLPKVPEMESGSLEPWELMRQFQKTFGLDQMAAAVKQAEALVTLGARKPTVGTFRRPDAKPTIGLPDALAARIEHRDG